MITGTTRLYAIVGDPIAHVRTPMALNAFFAEQAVDAVCLPFQVGRDGLDDGWAGLRQLRNLDGFIVTGPHKAAAAQLCDRLVEDAVHVGVVNAVRREPAGSFTGTLLDGRGFVAGLRAQGHEPSGRRIYIAGAGGAGQALAFALAANGAAAITIHNRTREAAADLVARLGRVYPVCRAAVGAADASGHDIVVNATSLGLEPGDALSIDLESVDQQALVAEIVMNPKLTPLLTAAEARGHRIHFGTSMLDGQLGAMKAFFGLGQGARPTRAA